MNTVLACDINYGYKCHLVQTLHCFYSKLMQKYFTGCAEYRHIVDVEISCQGIPNGSIFVNVLTSNIVSV